jgi:hypothetical protein
MGKPVPLFSFLPLGAPNMNQVLKELIQQNGIDGLAMDILHFYEGARYDTNMDMLRRHAENSSFVYGYAANELLTAISPQPALQAIFEDMSPFSAARVLARLVVKLMDQSNDLSMEMFQQECDTDNYLAASLGKWLSHSSPVVS